MSQVHEGFLGIQCPELRFYGVNNFLHIRARYKALLQTGKGKELTDGVRADPRVKDLLGKLVVVDVNYDQFDLEAFLLWYLSRINNVGEQQARRDLDNYLNAESVTYLLVVWISNIKVDHKIHLFDDYYLVPFDEMPESLEKYMAHDSSGLHQLGDDVADVALVRAIEIPKTYASTNGERFLISWIWRSELNEMLRLVDLLTLIHGCCAHVSCYTGYLPENYPFGLFLGFNTDMHIPYTHSHFCGPFEYVRTADTDMLKKQLAALLAKSDDEQELITRILQRISQAKNRINIEDKILDLGIVLEMLLLNDQDQGEMSYRLALRGAYLLGASPTDRSCLYAILRRLYKLRSKVAHTGQLKGKMSSSATEEIDKYFEIVEHVCSHIILSGWPKWDALIMGEGSD